MDVDNVILFQMYPILHCDKTIENSVYIVHMATLIEDVNMDGNWLRAKDLKESLMSHGYSDKDIKLINKIESNLNEFEDCGYLKLQIKPETIKVVSIKHLNF